MYSNFSAAAFSATAPATAAVLPLDFPLGLDTEPLWLLLGGFAIFAALQAVKRIAPTWSDITGDAGDYVAYSTAKGGSTSSAG